MTSCFTPVLTFYATPYFILSTTCYLTRSFIPMYLVKPSLSREVLHRASSWGGITLSLCSKKSCTATCQAAQCRRGRVYTYSTKCSHAYTIVQYSDTVSLLTLTQILPRMICTSLECAPRAKRGHMRRVCNFGLIGHVRHGEHMWSACSHNVLT